MSGRDARIMRERLAAVGIELEPAPAERPALRAVPCYPDGVDVDRDAIREVLVAAGAPARDLGWLTSSCPSMAEALAYQPTIHQSWCGQCGGIVACNTDGCIACSGVS